MANFQLDLRVAAVGVPWVAALAIAVGRRHARPIAFVAALVSVAASVLLLRGAPGSESLDEVLMVLFSCLTLGATLVIPQRDCTPATMSGMAFLLGSTLLGYSADDLLVLLAAWMLTA